MPDSLLHKLESSAATQSSVSDKRSLATVRPAAPTRDSSPVLLRHKELSTSVSSADSASSLSRSYSMYALPVLAVECFCFIWTQYLAVCASTAILDAGGIMLLDEHSVSLWFFSSFCLSCCPKTAVMLTGNLHGPITHKLVTVGHRGRHTNWLSAVWVQVGLIF